MEWVSTLPLLAVLAMLFARQHMLAAGFVGGLLALIISALFRGSLPAVQETVGGNTVNVVLDVPRVIQQFNSSIPAMLGFTSPIVNAATAAMVAGAGGYAAALELARRGLRGRVEYLAPFVVLLQAFATYTAGLGAGNTVITAPLIAAALGAPRGVMAGMALATAAAFTTSPSSAESALVSRLTGLPDTGPYADVMRPFFLLSLVMGMLIAWWDVRNRERRAAAEGEGEALGTGQPDNRGVAEGRQGFKLDPNASTGELWRLTIPALWLLFAVIFGRTINDLLRAGGLPMFMAPVFYVSVTVLLVVLLTRQSLEQAAQGLIDGSSFILVRLFSVGIFLAFINMIGDIGAFRVLANAALTVPQAIVVPVAAIIGFLIAIPAGAYSVAVMALVGPILAQAGFGALQLGFVMMVIGMGTQVSLVQINVAALSYGFNVSIPQVVRNNAPALFAWAIVLSVLSFVFAR